MTYSLICSSGHPLKTWPTIRLDDSSVSSIKTLPSLVFKIDSKSLPTFLQCCFKTSSFLFTVSRDPNRLQASAYFATISSVFFSPPPPTIIGGEGRCIGLGLQYAFLI